MISLARRISVSLAVACLIAAGLGSAPAQEPADLSHLNYRLTDFGFDYEMLYVPGGTLVMGTRQTMPELATTMKDTSWAMESESPLVTVEMRPFWMGRTEVTVGMYRKFVEETGHRTLAEEEGYIHGEWQADGEMFKGLSWSNPGYPVTDDHPVSCLAQPDLEAFIAWLNEKTGHQYGCPVETQFEYVARAGTEGSWYFGNRHTEMSAFEVYMLSSAGAPEPVASKQANPWGFHDILGNLRERQSNLWGNRPDTDAWIPAPEVDEKAACFLAYATRGMSFNSSPIWLRASARNLHPADRRNAHTGFRLARMADDTTAGTPAKSRITGLLKIQNAKGEVQSNWHVEFVPADWSRGAVRAKTKSGAFEVMLLPDTYTITLRDPDLNLFVLEDTVVLGAEPTAVEIAVQLHKVTVSFPKAEEADEYFVQINHRHGFRDNQPLFSRRVSKPTCTVELPAGTYQFDVVAAGGYYASSPMIPIQGNEEVRCDLPAVVSGVEQSLTVTLPPGEYSYKFWSENDSWLPDPLNPVLSGDEWANHLFKVPGGAVDADGNRNEWPKVDDATGEVTFKFAPSSTMRTFVRGSFNNWRPSRINQLQ